MANETIIAYNGSTIATLEAGQTATIKAAEYDFDHDLVFKAGIGGGGATAIIADLNAITIDNATVKKDSENIITIT